MAERTRRVLSDRIDIGLGLIGFTVLIVGVAATAIGYLRESLGLVVLVALAAAALLAVLWVAAVRNARVESATRRRLEAEHPGALVERVRLWSLPHGRAEPHLPLQFVVADAREISFETSEQDVLLRVPVDELGFIGLATAQGDRVRDRALTLVYGDERLAVQFFPATYAALPKLHARLRTAIGRPETPEAP